MVSSGDDAGEKGEEDSEATVDDAVDASPPSQTELLRSLSDDDNGAEPPAKEPPRSTGAVTRSVAAPLRRSGRTTPKKSDAAPPPRGDTSAVPTVDAAPKPAVARSASPRDAAKPVPRKAGGALALLKKRAFVASDE
jgi:hypothetical protein